MAVEEIPSSDEALASDTLERRDSCSSVMHTGASCSSCPGFRRGMTFETAASRSRVELLLAPRQLRQYL